jgi:hypothetical protein
MNAAQALRIRATALDAEADEKAPLRGPGAPRPSHDISSADGRDPATLRLIADEFRELADQIENPG